MHADPGETGSCAGLVPDAQLAGLAAGLAGRGHQVVVHTRLDHPGQPRAERCEAGYLIQRHPAGAPRPVPMEGLLPYVGAFRDGLRQHWAGDTPDVVHAHYWLAGLAALAAARPLGVPVVQSFHTLGIGGQRRAEGSEAGPVAARSAERDLGQHVGRVIAASSAQAFELVRLGVPRQRIAVIPSGVDTEHFHPGTPPDGVGSRSAPRLLAVEPLSAGGGVADAVRALALLPGCELAVAGGPPAEQLAQDAAARDLMSVARGVGVADRVRLLGGVDRDQLPELYRSAQALLCLSVSPGSGGPALEAMACGVPVVATSTGAVVDAVVHGVTGLLVPAQRPRLAAQAVRTLLERPELRATLAAGALHRARTHYPWSRVAAQTAAVYQAALAPVQRGPAPTASAEVR